jgi:integrase
MAEISSKAAKIEKKMAKYRKITKKTASKDKADSTLRTYGYKINGLRKWLKENELFEWLKEDGSIVCPLSEDILNCFFGYLLDDEPDSDDSDQEQEEVGQSSAAAVEDTATVANKSTKEKKAKQSSTIDQYASAITWMYRNYDPPITNISVVAELKKLRKGLKRTEADKKQAGLLPALQGKAPLAFAGYQILSEYALMETRKDCMYARLYVILCWNLVSRANNVGKILYSHISWSQDSMVINLPKTKGDQEGANDFQRHVYANPQCPHLCPVLAIAIHVFSCGFTRHEEAIQLFCSPDIQTRFGNWLHDVFEKLDNDTLGLQGLSELENGDEFGSHSFRLINKSYPRIPYFDSLYFY